MTKVFIDGSSGTTGLRIYERISARPDIEQIHLDEAVRKDPAARRDAIARADVAFMAPLASRFYRYHLINLADNNPGDAYLAALHAAWVCDDCGDREYADFCRQRVLEVLPWYRKAFPGDETALAIEADVLRRTRQFDWLLEKFSSVRAYRPLLNILLDFQMEKARAHDTRCYTVADALRFRKMN